MSLVGALLYHKPRKGKLLAGTDHKVLVGQERELNISNPKPDPPSLPLRSRCRNHQARHGFQTFVTAGKMPWWNWIGVN